MTPVTEPYETSLWGELNADPAPGHLVRRRVMPHLRHDVFLGETRPQRERVVIMELFDDDPRLPKLGPSPKGLKIDVDTRRPGCVRIVLTTRASAAEALFTELSLDLLRVVAADESNGIAQRVLNRLLGWKHFFALDPVGFGPESAAGLFSELFVLRTLLLAATDGISALESWTGPNPSLHDFQHGRIAVEVKSFRGNGLGRLTISSESQLETTGVDGLYLAYLRIDQREHGNGQTIRETIDEVRAHFSDDVSASFLLEDRLRSYGWRDGLTSARPEKFSIRSAEYFGVFEGFPRLIPTGIPIGITSVSYAVERSALDHYLVTRESVLDSMRVTT